jgi:hypothetical protein
MPARFTSTGSMMTMLVCPGSRVDVPASMVSERLVSCLEVIAAAAAPCAPTRHGRATTRPPQQKNPPG